MIEPLSILTIIAFAAAFKLSAILAAVGVLLLAVLAKTAK